MIARLSGTLVHRDAGRCIVDVQGVGYEVWATSRALDAWQEAEAAVVWVSTQVREDAITLYGFETDTERVAFQTMLGVSGVGPKVALAALDTLAVAELAQAIEADDVRGLGRIPGVGRKTAQRLALELKGKLPVDFRPSAARTRAPADPLPLALAQLDYGKTEIDQALRGLEQLGIAPDAPLQERLAASLRVLSGST